MKTWSIALIPLTLSASGLGACLGPSELVAAVSFKSRPEMHVRHCTGQLSVPYSGSFLKGPRHVTEVFITECEAQGLYETIHVGTKVVGHVEWIERPGIMNKLGDIVPLCTPRFSLTGIVRPINFR